MELTFNQFITKTKIYESYSSCTEAMAVYNYLNLNDNVNKMIFSTLKGRPALEAVVDNLEAIFKSNKEFDFSVDQVRQCIGSMVEEIIGAYGYKSEKNLPINNRMFFKNAIKYEI